MDSYQVLVEKEITFHGTWVAGYRVSERLLKSIGDEFASKPSRECKLILTTKGLTLELANVAEGKSVKTNEVEFNNIREISENPFNPLCLDVIYLDSQNRFTVMVCSSRNPEDLADVSRAFRKHYNGLRLHSPPGHQSLNWTLRQQNTVNTIGHSPNHQMFLTSARGRAGPARNQSAHTRMATNSLRMSRDTFGFLRVAQPNESYSYLQQDDPDDMDGDVFYNGHSKMEDVPLERVPVMSSDGQESNTLYNVGIQVHTGISDADFDAGSTVSNSSIQSLREDLHSLSEEMKAIKFLLEKSTGISTEEYYRRRDMHGNRHAVAFHTVPKTLKNGESSLANGQPMLENGATSGDDSEEMNQANDSVDNLDNNAVNNGAEDYDLRSVGMQAGSSGGMGSNLQAGGGRYTKRSFHGMNSAPAYVDRRKKRTGNAGAGGAAGASGAAVGMYAAAASPGHNANGVRHDGGQGMSSPRYHSTSSTNSNNSSNGSSIKNNNSNMTVVKSIEDVYTQGRRSSNSDKANEGTAGKASSKRKVVFAQ